jgi:hypothetical protein
MLYLIMSRSCRLSFLDVKVLVLVCEDVKGGTLCFRPHGAKHCPPILRGAPRPKRVPEEETLLKLRPELTEYPQGVPPVAMWQLGSKYLTIIDFDLTPTIFSTLRY